jgi:hypothetical protein
MISAVVSRFIGSSSSIPSAISALSKRAPLARTNSGEPTLAEWLNHSA